MKETSSSITELEPTKSASALQHVLSAFAPTSIAVEHALSQHQEIDPSRLSKPILTGSFIDEMLRSPFAHIVRQAIDGNIVMANLRNLLKEKIQQHHRTQALIDKIHSALRNENKTAATQRNKYKARLHEAEQMLEKLEKELKEFQEDVLNFDEELGSLIVEQANEWNNEYSSSANSIIAHYADQGITFKEKEQKMITGAIPRSELTEMLKTSYQNAKQPMPNIQQQMQSRAAFDLELGLTCALIRRQGRMAKSIEKEAKIKTLLKDIPHSLESAARAKVAKQFEQAEHTAQPEDQSRDSADKPKSKVVTRTQVVDLKSTLEELKSCKDILKNTNNALNALQKEHQKAFQDLVEPIINRELLEAKTELTEIPRHTMFSG